MLSSNYRHSKETRMKISQLRTGKHHSKETKKKIGDARRGRKLTLEHKEKLREASKKLWATPEYRNKALKGLRIAWSKPEYGVNISKRSKGRELTEEHKRNISEARKGRKPSLKTRKNMSIARMGTMLRSDNPNWRGGKTMSGPYIMIRQPDHPRSNKNGYVREHIFVWEDFWREAVPPGFVIHHIDHNSKNNDITNLVLMIFRSHCILHARQRKRNRRG